jgi:predicted component of type VI protein secretion system
MLREAVEAYEPRLGQVRVAVSEPREEEREILRARIDGVLIIDGVPESVAFDTALHGGAAGVNLADMDEA